MSRTRIASILAALMFVSSFGMAKDLALPAPDPARGSLAITLETKPPIKIGTMSANQVYFVRLDEGEKLSDGESVIPSNFSGKNQIYLLNAKPGRYVAVAAQLDGGPRTDSHAFLSEEAIQQTEVTVVPGKMTFIGQFKLQASTNMSQADSVEAHYYRLILPDVSKKGFMGRAFAGTNAYTARLVSVAKDAETTKAFWAEAIEKAFKKEPSWQDAVRHEMETPAQ